MKKYEVDFRDRKSGAISPIDTIVVADDYTTDDYVSDCDANGVCWGDGDIVFTEID